MTKFCSSCGMPLGEETKSDKYCQYCTDENGNLFPKEYVQQGIAKWLSGINPSDSSSDYVKRAEYYMKAMPAWAD